MICEGIVQSVAQRFLLCFFESTSTSGMPREQEQLSPAQQSSATGVLSSTYERAGVQVALRVLVQID
eukprot:scaffold452640_cov34-Prasinocladus_malaysianus.AAC.1